LRIDLEKGRCKKLKILIVDDAVFIRKVLRGILQELGMEVIGEASNGNEALRMVKEYMPDVVTLDITLPDTTGLELLKKIKELSNATDVIMVTAISNHDIVKEAMKVGAVNYITKPFSKEKIEEVLKNIKEKKFLALDKETKVAQEDFVTDSNEIADKEKENLVEVDISLEDTKEIIYDRNCEFDNKLIGKEVGVSENVTEEIQQIEKPGLQFSEYEEDKENKNTNVYDVNEGSAIEATEKEESGYGVVVKLEVEHKSGEEIVLIHTNGDVTYNVGRMKLGNGIIVTVEDCYLSSNINHEYLFKSNLIEKIETKEINGVSYIIIFTKAKKFDVHESEGVISIVVKKNKGVVSYSKNNKFLMIDNISSSNIVIEPVSEKEYLVKIVSNEVSLNEGETIVNDIILEKYIVEKVDEGYIVKVTLNKEARHEVIEGKTSFGIKFIEVNILKEIVIHHTNEETQIELITNSLNPPVVLDHDVEKGVIYAYLNNFIVSKSLLEKTFEFEEEYLENLKVVEDRDKGTSYLVIRSPAKRVAVLKDKGKTYISIKPNKAFLLYNLFQNCVVFQNVLPEEIEIQYNNLENSLEFKINNRYINLLKDPILNSEQFETFSGIEIRRVKSGYEGIIYLKGKSKIDISISKDKTSTNLFIIPLKKLNRIKGFEYEEIGAKGFLTLKCEGEIEYLAERDSKSGVISIIISTASLYNIEKPLIEFGEGYIEKLEFHEKDEDVIVNIYSKVEDYITKFVDNNIVVELEANVASITPIVKENIVKFEICGMEREEVDINRDEENNILILFIKRRDIYIEKGIKYLESDVIKRYQIAKENGYKIIIDVIDKVRYYISEEDDKLNFVIEKYPILNKVTVKEYNEELVEIELVFNRKGVKPLNVIRNDGEVDIVLGETLVECNDVEWDVKLQKIIKDVELLWESENLVLRVAHVYSSIDIIEESNILKIVFEAKLTQIFIQDNFVKIQNIDNSKVFVNTFAENGVIIVEIALEAANMSQRSIIQNSDKVLHATVVQNLEMTEWKVYIIYPFAISVTIENLEDGILLEVGSKKNVFTENELEI